MEKEFDKINNIKINPRAMRELGLEPDWQKNVSPAFVERVADTAEKYKDTLRRLSKH